MRDLFRLILLLCAKERSMQILDWEYFKHLEHYSVLYGNIFVNLYEGFINGPTKAEKRKYLNSVILPLLDISSTAYLYGKYEDHQVAEISGYCFPRSRGKLVLTGADNASITNLLTEISEPSERGTLLIEVPLKEELLAPIFKNCSDPTVMAGLSSCCTKSALAYTKKHLSNENVFVLLSHANSGLEWIFLLTSTESIAELARIVAKYCAVSYSYKTLYGPGADLAPLENKKSYGTGGHE